jgi:hypothetical protein
MQRSVERCREKERTFLQSARRQKPLTNPLCTKRSAVAISATTSRCPVGGGHKRPGRVPRSVQRQNLSFSQSLFSEFQLPLSLFRPPSPRAPAPRGTCHIRRSVLTFVAPDPQLALIVVAPALDPAPGGDHASVEIPRGYGDGGEVCVCWEKRG